MQDEPNENNDNDQVFAFFVAMFKFLNILFNLQ